MTDGGNLRAGIYERVSVKPRKGPEGRREARQIADRNAAHDAACQKYGWTVVGRWEDPGVSASKYARQKRRKAYESMRDTVAEDGLDILIFYMVNRADRKLTEWSRLLDECEERGKRIYLTVSDRLYDPADGEDWAQLANAGVAAVMDSNRISKFVRLGMRANLAQGKPHGPTPFGYVREYDEARMMTAQVPHPVTGPVRRDVVIRVARGDALTAIVHDLKAQGVKPPRSGEWGTASIRSMVLSPSNVAKRRYDPKHTRTGELTDGADWWEPLVDERTWEAACKRLNDARGSDPRPGRTGKKAHRYLLSYLAICGVCGGRLGVRKWHGSTIPAYCCWAHGHTGMRHDWLDQYVTGHACARLNTPEFWDELLNTNDAAARAAREEASALRRQITAYEEQALASPAAIDSLGRIITGLQVKMRDAERRGSVSTAPPHLLALYRQKDVTAVRELFEGSPIPTRKAILRDLYDGIILLPSYSKGRQSGFDRKRVLMVPARERS